jgi:large subunit ribosomal protein L15
MKLGNISPPKGATSKKKRLGIGPGSGTGKTAGKGHKGQKSRSGAKHRAWFEGGQMPLQQRLPKVGFNNPFRVIYQIVNLDDLAGKELSGEITPEVLKSAGLIASTKKPVKILGRGEISSPLQVVVQAVSASAAEKIIVAGGSVDAKAGGAAKAE